MKAKIIQQICKTFTLYQNGNRNSIYNETPSGEIRKQRMQASFTAHIKKSIARTQRPQNNVELNGRLREGGPNPQAPPPNPPLTVPHKVCNRALI